MPPVNLDAECGLLASVLLDNRAMNDVSLLIRGPDDFFRAAHVEIYRTIKRLYDEGKPFDVLLLAEAMGDRYDEIGGDDLLAEIMESVPHAANALHYADVVRQKAICRSVIDAATEILREGYAGQLTADALLELAEQRIYAVAESEATGTTRSASEIIDMARHNLARRMRGEITGIITGFPDVDDLTDGLQPGSLTILAGRPSMGKTSYALNVCENVAMDGTGSWVLFVSLEMAASELGDRLISGRARIDGWRLKNPANLTPDATEAIHRAGTELETATFLVDDTPARTITQIAANARRMKARGGLSLVVVDYIQLIDGQRQKGENRQEEVSRISKRLKILARELHVPVLVLAQLNRQSEIREDRRPRLADLRESGAIEQDADVVLLVHRPEMYDPGDRPGEADLIIAKNRNGATDTVKLRYRKHCTRFETMPPYGDAPAF